MKGAGTVALALSALAFAGCRTGRDFVENFKEAGEHAPSSVGMPFEVDYQSSRRR